MNLLLDSVGFEASSVMFEEVTTNIYLGLSLFLFLMVIILVMWKVFSRTGDTEVNKIITASLLSVAVSFILGCTLYILGIITQFLIQIIY